MNVFEIAGDRTTFNRVLKSGSAPELRESMCDDRLCALVHSAQRLNQVIVRHIARQLESGKAQDRSTKE